MESLNEDAKKKKKGQILYIRGRDKQTATSAKLFNIMNESYGLSADLTETINLMNINAIRMHMVLVGVIKSFVIMCKDIQ